MRYKYSIEELRLSVKSALSVAQVCRDLNIRPVGGNYKTLNSLFKLHNIDISHFTGKAWNVGTKFRKFCKEYSFEEIFTIDSKYSGGSKLKDKLFQFKIKDRICECCKNRMWLDKEINLEVHHLNGINTDNRIENLQLLCPNCHSYTDNFRGKNQKLSALSEKRDVEYRKFKETPVEERGNLEPSPINRKGAETLHGIPKPKIRKINFCLVCNAEILGKSYSKFCSQECYKTDSRKNIPKVPELLSKFEEIGSYLQVGKYYGVSDNCVKKWIKSYGIEDMVKRKSRPQME